MSEKITVEEWIQELNTLGFGADAEGLQTKEIAAKLGRSIKWVREKLAVAIEAGQVEMAGHRLTSSVDGRAVKSPVYRVRS